MNLSGYRRLVREHLKRPEGRDFSPLESERKIPVIGLSFKWRG